MRYHLISFISALVILVGCQTAKDASTSGADSTATAKDSSRTTRAQISDDSLLTLVQYRTFQYFWDGAEPTSGAASQILFLSTACRFYRPELSPVHCHF